MAEEDQEEGLVCQELQVLQSIYLEELAISREDRVKLRITLHPATGDDPESQYVRLTLHLSLPPQYPDDPPEISVSNPRGLCDEQIHSISDRLHQTAAESLGGPLLYELIEKGKEMLTASNIPRGLCVICLYGFQEGDSLTKTPCFHHFHSHCLGRYAKHCQEENPTDVLPRTPRPAEVMLVFCPVCRESLTCDLQKLQEAPPPQQAEDRYVPDLYSRQRDEDLQQIYQRQLENGGIIDIEAERQKYFISIQEAPPSDEAVSASDVERQAGPPSCDGHSAIPLGGKQQGSGGHRVQRRHGEGQHWRGGRGWRPRQDTRRVWRREEGHRGFHANGGAVRVSLRGGANHRAPEDM